MVSESERKVSSVELLKYLTHDCKIGVNEGGKRGDTPLPFAVWYSSAKILVENLHADPLRTNKDGRTSLELACHFKAHNPCSRLSLISWPAILAA